MRNVSSVWPLWLAVAGLSVQAAAQAPARSSARASTLRQVAYVKASNPGEEDHFGHAIALSGDGNTMAVGAPMESSAATGVNGKGENDPGDSSGAVYVYSRSGTRWAQQAYIKASNAGTDDQFGFAVTLSGDGNTLAVSAPYEDSAATGINGNQADNSMENSGAVYVFTRTGSTASDLTVNYSFSGTASKWTDYRRKEGDMPDFIVIPAGASSATLTIYPVVDNVAEGPETAILTLAPAPAYNMGQPKTATVTILETPL